MSFGRPGIAFLLFRSQSASSQGDAIGADHFAACDQLEQVVFLQDKDGIGFCGSGGRLSGKPIGAGQEREGNQRASGAISSLLLWHRHIRKFAASENGNPRPRLRGLGSVKGYCANNAARYFPG
jgi:hypothetical protein